MSYEVAVVGGGVGGLTAAALLAARGLKVCLLERQSEVGGCAATIEHAGHKFEPTHGLYCGWEVGGIFERLFSTLGTTPPRTRLQSTAYTVRLPDLIEVPRTTQIEDFEAHLASAFPECAPAAIDFYRGFANLTTRETEPKTIAAYLSHCSTRFRRFVDVQLQTLVQGSSDECSAELAASALDPQRQFWRIEGGAQSLIDTLAQSFKQSGGTLRLNSTGLRLAYGSNGVPIGVDLLSGEQVIVTRAIISNLTIWDTYGKLIGPTRTPRAISSSLKDLRAWGAYQMFLTLNKSVASSLPLRPVLALTDWQDNQPYDPEDAQLVFSLLADAANDRAEQSSAAVVSAYTNAEDWFSFHEDHTTHEERDQSMLERVWSRLHRALPELGEGSELIETATPRTSYESTRRRFGMIGRATSASGLTGGGAVEKPYPNVFLVGDTVSDGFGLEGIVQSSWNIANKVLSIGQ